MAGRTTRYVLTTERLTATGGLIGKHGESMELYRVKDVRVHNGAAARGRGDVLIRSVDASTPEVKLEAVFDPDDVAELVRRKVGEARRRQNISMREGLSTRSPAPHGPTLRPAGGTTRSSHDASSGSEETSQPTGRGKRT